MDLVKEELENSMNEEGAKKKDESASDDEEDHKNPSPRPIGAVLNSVAMKHGMEEEEDDKDAGNTAAEHVLELQRQK